MVTTACTSAERSVRGVELVLASGSPYRAEVLRGAGYRIVVDPPHVDERALDHLFHERGAEGLALELARRKAAAVGPRHPGVAVVAGDQVGVLQEGSSQRMLTKASDVAAAVAQLMTMSGTTHRLLNGIVVARYRSDGSAEVIEGLDTQVVTMADYDERTAFDYVTSFEPFDTAGSYRLEDDAGLVVSVQGEHDSGVLGMPLPLLGRMLERLSVGS